jgi:hypothetical protein
MHPCAADIPRLAVEISAEGSPADAVSRLHDENIVACCMNMSMMPYWLAFAA